ncbi:putative MFS family arabinose efflux permease [Mucilaginibacter yixingensis]|uniref:Putative MFS family arabinose efflux permease n=1 Tax=Mucilaginibacter yixingensis TaxID=1295612 RepID=A0A2T5J9Q4_9SPHI|nr:MFS transporter [Mucilaginibacter yixingensis]PTQ96739.1 putative MFS family arabinose efflux permease [Mucilaginibacter yixingensis]
MVTSPVELYKQAYSGLSRNSWILSLVMFINRSGTMVIPFMTLYCTQILHFSVGQAGLILGIFGLGSITGAFIGGKLTDRYGFYDIQVAALIVGGLLFMLLGFQRSFTMLAIVSFILSLCNDAFRPANSTAIAYHSSPENKTRSYSLNRLAVNLGWAFGGAIGGMLASFNYHLLFWADGCTNILAGLVLLKLMPRSVIKSNHVIKERPTGGASAYHDKVYIAFIVLALLFAACFFQMFTIQPLFYKSEWGLNERFIGVLMAANGVFIALFEMVIVHNLEGRRHGLKYIATGVTLAAIAFGLLNFMPAAKLSATLIILLITLGEILAMPFMNAFWIVRTSEHNRGQYAAMYSMCWSAAQILAPTIGSQIIIWGHYSMLWWVMTVSCTVSAVGFVVLYKWKFAR